jgi:hypothetical protein
MNTLAQNRKFSQGQWYRWKVKTGERQAVVKQPIADVSRECKSAQQVKV